MSPVTKLIIAAVLWSIGGFLIKLVDWSIIGIAGGRSFFAAILLYFLFYRGKRSPRITKISIGGGVAYFLTLAFFVAATRLTTAANAIVLQYTAPIYILLFGAALLGERPTRLDWIAVITAIFGMGLFFVDKLSADGMAGNLCAILSGISFATMVVLLRKQKDGNPIDSPYIGNFITALLLIPALMESVPDLRSLLFLIILGVFQIGFSYALYTQAIKHVTALEALLIPIIEPILNPIWVMIILGEVPGPWAIIGAAVVVTAVTARALYSIEGQRTDR